MNSPKLMEVNMKEKVLKSMRLNVKGTSKVLQDQQITKYYSKHMFGRTVKNSSSSQVRITILGNQTSKKSTVITFLIGDREADILNPNIQNNSNINIQERSPQVIEFNYSIVNFLLWHFTEPQEVYQNTHQIFINQTDFGQENNSFVPKSIAKSTHRHEHIILIVFDFEPSDFASDDSSSGGGSSSSSNNSNSSNSNNNNHDGSYRLPKIENWLCSAGSQGHPIIIIGNRCRSCLRRIRIAFYNR